MIDSSFDCLDFDYLLNDLRSDDFNSTTTNDDNNSTTDDSTCTTASDDESVHAKHLCKHSRLECQRNLYVYIPKPRILRTDIRRSYTSMLIHVMNSLDFPLLYGFLETYCAPNLQQCSLKYDGTTKQRIVTSLYGIPHASQYYYSTMQMAPDCTSSISETVVHLSSATTRSRIVSKFKFNFTKIFEEPSGPNVCKANCPPDATPPAPVVAVGNKRKNGMSEKLAFIQSLQQSVDSQKVMQQLASQPVDIEVQGTFTMFTDENLRIHRMVMETHGACEDGVAVMC